MLETKTSIKRVGKSGAAVIYVPSKLVSDFLFPFPTLPSQVLVKVDSSKLIIEPLVNREVGK